MLHSRPRTVTPFAPIRPLGDNRIEVVLIEVASRKLTVETRRDGDREALERDLTEMISGVVLLLAQGDCAADHGPH